MTSPVQVYGAVAQQYIDKAATLWVDAGKQSDSAEGLGIDGRIALIHGLIDLWLKTSASVIEIMLKGPGALPGTQDSEPLPSEEIQVAPTTYVRQLEAVGPFTRVGMPNHTIPNWMIGFVPSSLAAGDTTFRLRLKNHEFVGANYVGTIRLSTQSLTGIVPDEKVVTVGL